jgi:hypothetical protein
MGSGYRTFSPGEVLTGSNVMNYLMEQAVMSFATAAARDAAITAPEEGMVAYAQDTDIYWSYTSAAWVPIAYAGSWTTYTPTWATSGGAAPAVGNGTLTGRYSRMGKTINVIISLTAGTTTTFGASPNTWSFALPFAAVTAPEQSLPMRIFDSSGPTAYVVASATLSSGTTAVPQGNIGGGGLATMTAIVPIPWGNADKCTIFGTYEAA